MTRIALLFTILILIVCCSRKSSKSENDFDSISIGYDSPNKQYNTINEELVFFTVEEMPQFRNGDRDLIKYILENTNYPESAVNDSIEGRVFISFIVNEDGRVSNVEVARGIRDDLNNECIRVIENMPKWKPGRQMGKLVKVHFTMPFRFKLKIVSDGKISITPKKIKKNEEINFNLYPNPATEFVIIEIPNINLEFEYQIINSKGQILKSGELFNNKQQISIKDLENGFYIVRITSIENGRIETKKFIKK